MEANFFERVYVIARQIPEGKVTSYGAIAKALGTGRSTIKLLILKSIFGILKYKNKISSFLYISINFFNFLRIVSMHFVLSLQSVFSLNKSN